MESLPHNWKNQSAARNESRFDQWLNVKRNSNARTKNRGPWFGMTMLIMNQKNGKHFLSNLKKTFGNFGTNPLEFFRQYNLRLHQAHLDYVEKRVAELPAEIQTLEEQLMHLNQSSLAFHDSGTQITNL